ncbi:MAG TPA: succinylglutamate desuccinylase [Gemmatimonadetes bacterium]|nr:succinylglutamate desuccinylase [Gemmatimonadota bacterium]
MTEVLRIGNLEVKPNSTMRGAILTGKKFDGRPAEIPILVCQGKENGPKLWLNGATHGDEPEGALSIFKTFEWLEHSLIRGTVVGVPAMNVPAFEAGKRGDPLDGFTYDMNRIYPGRPDGYPTERSAWAHWEAMRNNCDLQIAIHSGGEHSYLAHMIFASDNPESLELAAAMGANWDLVFRSGQGGNNPASKIGDSGKAGITVELGGNCRTLTSDFHEITEDLSKGYRNVMKHYKMIEDDEPPAYARQWRMGHQQALLAPSSGMWVGTPNIPFETELPKGTVLGSIYDLYGDVQSQVQAPEDGVVFGLRSRPSVMAGEWCCFFGIIDEIRTDLTGS